MLRIKEILDSGFRRNDGSAINQGFLKSERRRLKAVFYSLSPALSRRERGLKR
jgi:hypothetical protein